MQAAILILIFVVVFAVAMAVQSAKRATDRESGVVMTFADLSLTDTELIEGSIAAGQRHSLAGLVARVEDSGTLNRRITATRLATLGPFALAAKKKQDDREVYLTIEGPTTAIVKSVPFKTNPSVGEQARKFAAQLNLMSRTSAPVAVEAVPTEPAFEDSSADTFTVTLTSTGTRKIQVIKEVRQLSMGMGLKEAKELVERTPAVLETMVDANRAEQIRETLERAGASVWVSAD